MTTAPASEDRAAARPIAITVEMKLTRTGDDADRERRIRRETDVLQERVRVRLHDVAARELLERSEHDAGPGNRAEAEARDEELTETRPVDAPIGQAANRSITNRRELRAFDRRFR